MLLLYLYLCYCLWSGFSYFTCRVRPNSFHSCPVGISKGIQSKIKWQRKKEKERWSWWWWCILFFLHKCICTNVHKFCYTRTRATKKNVIRIPEWMFIQCGEGRHASLSLLYTYVYNKMLYKQEDCLLDLASSGMAWNGMVRCT